MIDTITNIAIVYFVAGIFIVANCKIKIISDDRVWPFSILSLKIFVYIQSVILWPYYLFFKKY